MKCQGFLKNKKGCSRLATDGVFCWQHKKESSQKKEDFVVSQPAVIKTKKEEPLPPQPEILIKPEIKKREFVPSKDSEEVVVPKHCLKLSVQEKRLVAKTRRCFERKENGQLYYGSHRLDQIIGAIELLLHPNSKIVYSPVSDMFYTTETVDGHMSSYSVHIGTVDLVDMKLCAFGCLGSGGSDFLSFLAELKNSLGDENLVVVQ